MNFAQLFLLRNSLQAIRRLFEAKRSMAMNAIEKSALIRRWFVYVAVVALGACASLRPVEHGLNIEVKGNQSIYNVEVLYGKEVIRFKNIYNPGGGSGWNAPMLIPDKMTVRWSVYGQEREVVVNLAGKTAPTNRLARWRLRFFGEKLEVWRDDDDPGSQYYFKPAVQVYP